MEPCIHLRSISSYAYFTILLKRKIGKKGQRGGVIAHLPYGILQGSLAYHSVHVGHVEANAGQEVADRVHDEDRVPADKWALIQISSDAGYLNPVLMLPDYSVFGMVIILVGTS